MEKIEEDIIQEPDIKHAGDRIIMNMISYLQANLQTYQELIHFIPHQLDLLGADIIKKSGGSFLTIKSCAKNFEGLKDLVYKMGEVIDFLREENRKIKNILPPNIPPTNLH